MKALRARRTDDSGFTLVEFLVAMVIVIILLAVSMSSIVASNSAVKTSRDVQGLNEEARQAINRIARDVRQARVIITAVNPDGPTFNAANIVAVRFTSDFDGDGCINGVGTAPCLAYSASNPEDVTYCYAPTTAQLYVIDSKGSPVTPAITTCTGGQPLLAGNVAKFQISYRSNLYRDDLNPSDGVTTWRELDDAGPPDGNANGVLDAVELLNVDSVVLDLTMSVAGHKQTYRTQVDLRNRSQ